MPLDGLQLGHYRLVRLLGSGGMGEVYLAEDTRINRQLAIKVVRTEVDPYPDANASKEATRLFQREMKAITVLDHPHILPLIDFGEEHINNTMLTYMVMPFRPEGSLADWLRQRSSSEILSPPDVAHFLLQAADALQHAHDHYLIHQDVKPSNFLIRNRATNPNHPDLLLADFGIAKFTTATATASQSIRGTPAFMAPEQWDGQPVAATDQYALAIMAYQLLTGRPPFQGGPGQVMRQHFIAQPQPPSTLNRRISPALDAVILRALAKQPADRFPSIAAFAQAFQAAVQSTEVSSGTLASNIPGGATAQNAPGGTDIRATLAISKTEALTGTSRTLTLPGGRRVTIAVPAGMQNGQVIHLGGQGEPSSSGRPTGSLILTIAIKQAEEPVAGAESVAQTVRASNPSLPSLTVPARDSALPKQNIPLTTSADSKNITSHPKSHIMRLALLTGLTVILLASSIFSVVAYQNHIKQVNVASTATVEAANATATASVIAAVEAANATATASVIAANPYPSYLTGNGTLALYDSLSQSDYWYNSSNTSFGGACQFTNGAYHISQTKPQRLFDCVAGPSFTNFAFEVHMTIIQGDCGGIVFRRDSTNANLYVFQVCQNGSYRLLHFVNYKVDKTLTSNSSSTIHTGLNQSNVIAVVANGNTLDLYVNQQKIDNVSDSTYSHGQVGVFAHDYSNPTEVVYSNARVWML